jgi:hypothetical protein
LSTFTEDVPCAPDFSGQELKLLFCDLLAAWLVLLASRERKFRRELEQLRRMMEDKGRG